MENAQKTKKVLEGMGEDLTNFVVGDYKPGDIDKIRELEKTFGVLVDNFDNMVVVYKPEEAWTLEQHKKAQKLIFDKEDEPFTEYKLELPWNNERNSVLSEASKIINGERQETYGDPEDSFQQIAGYWSTYLHRDVSASDVAAMMILLKLARMDGGKFHRDNAIDICGYAALWAEMEGCEDE